MKGLTYISIHSQNKHKYARISWTFLGVLDYHRE